MSKICVAAFDLDGTLTVLNSALSIQALHSVFKTAGLESKAPTAEEYFSEYGPPYLEYFRSRGVMLSETQIWTIYNQVYQHGSDKLYDDVHQTLSIISRREIPMVVISGQANDTLSHLCQTHGIAQYFNLMLGDVVCKKEELLNLCAAYRCEPKEIVYAGDFGRDMEQTKEAGGFALGVTRGQPTREILLRKGADLVVDHLRETHNFFLR